MIRQTGGFSFGATSTRSRPASRARLSASSVGMIPSCSPSPAITRIGVIRICSLIRCCFSMAHASRTSTADARPRAWKTANTRAMHWHVLCRRHSSSALPAASDEQTVRQAFLGQTRYYPKDRGAASTGLRKSGETGVIVSAAPNPREPPPWGRGASFLPATAGGPTALRAAAAPQSATGPRQQTAAAPTLRT